MSMKINKKLLLPAVAGSVAVIILIVIIGVKTGFFSSLFRNKDLDNVLKPVEFQGYETVYPEKIKGNLTNPGMGFVGLEEPTYTGIPNVGWAGDLPELNEISLSTSWAHIETSDGLYDWSNLDQVINYWTSKGKRINLRICTDTLILPNTYKGVPDWLLSKYHVGYETLHYDSAAPVTTYKAIDVKNAAYQKYLRRFLSELSKKYAANKMVDTVEIRGFGVWGEWHSGHSFNSYEERIKTLSDIIDEYYNAYKETGKLIVLSCAWEYKEDTKPYVANPANYQDYVKWSAFDHAMSLPNVTFRRDSGAGGLKYDSDARILSDFMRSGKRLPLLAEYYASPQDAISSSLGFSVQEGIDDILFKMKPNYITTLGWVNAEAAKLIKDGYSYLFDRGNEKMGYRLAIDYARYEKQAAPGSEISVLTSFSNSGTGRFWYKYPLKVYLLDKDGNEAASSVNEKFDARTILNGDITDFYTKVNLPKDIKEGKYKVAAAIVDETGKPAISLGMAGNDGNKRYALGEIEITASAKVQNEMAKSMSYEDAQNYKFKANTVYQITFGYTPKFDANNYKFGSYDGYVFKLESLKGGNDAAAGYTKWQDVSNEHGYKTILLGTKNYNDYKLNIESENFGDISIDEVYITELSGMIEDFEGYDFENASSLLMPATTQTGKVGNGKQAIDGKNSLIISGRKKGHVDGVKMDNNVYTLRPNTTYTISFDFKAITNTGNGGYMYLSLSNSKKLKNGYDIAEWYEREDTPVTRKTYTFTTDDASDNIIAFGAHNSGTYAIDNLVLVQNCDGDIVKGEDIKNEINTPKPLNKNIGDTEDFESKSFGGTMFSAGANNWGRMTTKPDEVISGSTSLLGRVEQAESEWYEFAYSRNDLIKFARNSAYRITFDYKVLKEPEKNGNFYCTVRSNSLGFSKDVGYTKFIGDIGKVNNMTIDFITGDADDYYFIFGMFQRGEIVIDNVKFTKLPNPQEFNGAIDFETGSTVLSHVLSSTDTGLSIVTNDKNKVIDGKYSLYADNNTGAEWFDYMYTDKNSVKLSPNKTYEVSFKYKIVREVPKSSSGFQVFARSYTGGVKADVGTTRFKGKAGEVITQKMRFTTKNYNDYFIAFGMHMGGAIVIDDIRITPGEPISTIGSHNFENGSIEASGFQTADGGVITDNAISGSYSVEGINDSKEWYDYLRTDVDTLKFKPNTTYKVTFAYEITKELPSKSSGFQVYARSNIGGVKADVGTMRFKGKAGTKGIKAIVFTTKQYNDYFLSFGMHYSGGIKVDNINIQYSEKLNILGTHTFEDGSIEACGFRAADGGFISGKNVISGKYSVVGSNSGSEWYDFLQTDSNVLKMKPDTTYTVTFKYFILKPTPAGSVGFQFFARSDKGGVKADAGNIRWNGITGALGTKTITFTTGNYDDYYLSFGMHRSGSIAIDDVAVSEK